MRHSRWLLCSTKRFESKDTSFCLTAAAAGSPKRSRDPDFGIKMAIVSEAVALIHAKRLVNCVDLASKGRQAPDS